MISFRLSLDVTGLPFVMSSSASKDAKKKKYQGYTDQKTKVILASIVMHFVHLNVWINK
jgi:hypothetical protein